MSSLPGLDLESFVAWNHNVSVEGRSEANVSIGMAERIGMAANRRPVLTADKFDEMLAFYEPFRGRVENQLTRFDEGSQSWRDYAGYAFDFIPDDVYCFAAAVIENLRNES